MQHKPDYDLCTVVKNNFTRAGGTQVEIQHLYSLECSDAYLGFVHTLYKSLEPTFFTVCIWWLMRDITQAPTFTAIFELYGSDL